MSSPEPGSVPSFEWFVTLGNLLTILISGSAVVGAVYTLIRYLRQNVTKGITEMKGDVQKDICDMRTDIKKDMTNIGAKFEQQENRTKEYLENNAERIEEVRNLIAVVERRIEDTKQDTNKRIDIRMSDILRLTDKLDGLREDHYKLSLAIAKRMDIQEDVARQRHDEVKKKDDG